MLFCTYVAPSWSLCKVGCCHCRNKKRRELPKVLDLEVVVGLRVVVVVALGCGDIGAYAVVPVSRALGRNVATVISAVI